MWKHWAKGNANETYIIITEAKRNSEWERAFVNIIVKAANRERERARLKTNWWATKRKTKQKHNILSTE